MDDHDWRWILSALVVIAIVAAVILVAVSETHKEQVETNMERIHFGGFK